MQSQKIVTKLISKLQLREATMADSQTLYSWRNDEQTRLASINTQVISRQQHEAWLSNSLKSNKRKIYIACLNNLDVATVRYDLEDNTYWLSWTVAPEYRQQGIGTQVVAALCQQITGTIMARVRSDNLGSCKIAEANGMKLLKQEQGIKIYLLPCTK